MRSVSRPAPSDSDWVAWRRRAAEEIQSLVAAHKPGEKIAVNDQLYKGAMPFLLSLFGFKCAYCESLITNTHPGDVEHYRPKGRIKNLDGTVVKTRDGHHEHPGYWWLCYEWANLLPSCIDCNRRRIHGEDKDAAAGKADLFPIEGARAEEPADSLPDEHALLLNPTERDFKPEEHFDFHPDGKIEPKTPRAQLTCDLLGLNLREKLVEQRAKAYTDGLQTLSDYVAAASAAVALQIREITPKELTLQKQVNAMWEGKTPHSAFACTGLREAQHLSAAHRFPVPLPLSG